MSDVHTFTMLMTFQAIFLVLTVLYASYMVELNCPSIETLQEQIEDVPFDEVNPTNTLTNTWGFIGLLFSGCSGIPWWIFLIVIAPSLIAMAVYVIPFLGS